MVAPVSAVFEPAFYLRSARASDKAPGLETLPAVTPWGPAEDAFPSATPGFDGTGVRFAGSATFTALFQASTETAEAMEANNYRTLAAQAYARAASL